MSIAAQGASGKIAVVKQQVPFAICGVAACAISLYVAPGLVGLSGALLAALMAAIAYRDAHDFIIPDFYSAAAFVLGSAAAIWTGEGEMISALAAALARAVVLGLAFLGIRLAYRRLRGRHGLGLGDVKLAAVAGVWLDWTTLPIAIEIAALSALTAVLVDRVITRRALKVTTRLPFGLFFAPAIWIGWLVETTLPWPWP